MNSIILATILSNVSISVTTGPEAPQCTWAETEKSESGTVNYKACPDGKPPVEGKCCPSTEEPAKQPVEVTGTANFVGTMPAVVGLDDSGKTLLGQIVTNLEKLSKAADAADPASFKENLEGVRTGIDNLNAKLATMPDLQGLEKTLNDLVKKLDTIDFEGSTPAGVWVMGISIIVLLALVCLLLWGRLQQGKKS